MAYAAMPGGRAAPAARRPRRRALPAPAASPAVSLCHRTKAAPGGRMQTHVSRIAAAGALPGRESGCCPSAARRGAGEPERSVPWATDPVRRAWEHAPEGPSARSNGEAGGGASGGRPLPGAPSSGAPRLRAGGKSKGGAGAARAPGAAKLNVVVAGGSNGPPSLAPGCSCSSFAPRGKPGSKGAA